MATESRTEFERTALPLPTGRWMVDGQGSEVRFRIRKLFWHPKGRFREVDGRLRVSEDGEFELTASAPVASLTTGIAPRDFHLRTRHFFDEKTFPTVKLELRSAEPVGDDRLRLRGDLTIKGTTRPVELLGSAEEHGDHLHLHAEGRIDRHEYGVVAPAYVEMGGLLLGREVELSLEARLGREPGRAADGRG